MIKLYRYRPINLYSLDSLRSEQYWCAKPTTFNDPFEFRLKTPSETEVNGIKGLQEIRDLNPHLDQMHDVDITRIAKEYVQRQINNFGVICFTETNDNILMWSHYANYHQGMCLGFEIEDTSAAAIYKVEYSDEYPELDFKNLWHKDGMMKVLWTKSKSWKYENEWRLITVEGNQLEAYRGTLAEVIFGCRTSNPNKQEIRAILQDKDVDFFDAQLDDNMFKINISEQVIH